MRRIVRTIEEALVAFGVFSLIFSVALIATHMDIIDTFLISLILSTTVSLPILISMEEK